MVNQTILNYFKDNRLKYALGELKKKVLSSGYPKDDVEEALKLLEESPAKPIASKPVEKGKKPSEKEEKPVDSKRGVKWMKVAGILGFVFLGITTILTIMFLLSVSFVDMPVFLNIVFLILGFFLIGLSFVYIYGFFKLGKHVDSKLIKISSFLSMLTFGLIILLFIVLLAIEGGSSGFTGNAISEGLASGGLETEVLVPIIVASVSFIFMSSLLCMFFIGLIKIRDKVRFAKIAGILGLVIFGMNIIVFALVVYFFLNPLLLFGIMMSSWFSSVSIGYTIVFLILNFCLMVFNSLVLFDASKKYEM